MLTRLILQNYRNYAYSQWVFDQRFIFLCGSNGAGKTNILETISLLNVPKGLRSADMKDLGMYDGDQPKDWTVFYDLTGRPASIESVEGKKTIRLDHKVSTQKQLRTCVRIFWVAPENDRLFAGTPSGRRNFIHQLMEIINPEYEEIYSQYMHLIQERSQILKIPNPNTAWLDGLEEKIANLAGQIYEKRTAFIETLNSWIAQLAHFHYHRFVMLDELHDDLIAQLKLNRSYDQIRGGCKVGPHKSDLAGYRQKMPLHLCSNGQQCIGLLAILLGLIKQYSQTQSVIFLIDEIFSHLDTTHQKLLLQELKTMPSVQTFITLPHTEVSMQGQVVNL